MRNVECVIEHYASVVSRSTLRQAQGLEMSRDASLARTLIHEGYG